MCAKLAYKMFQWVKALAAKLGDSFPGSIQWKDRTDSCRWSLTSTHVSGKYTHTHPHTHAHTSTHAYTQRNV